MTSIAVPTYDQISHANKSWFEQIKSGLGFMPNLYATFAHSEEALGGVMMLQNARTSLSPKAREVVSLVVSQVNGCDYCLAAHTAAGKKVGFNDAQLLELRRGRASFDAQLDALARLVRNIVSERGHADPALVQSFFDAGWIEANLVDAVVAIGHITMTNYLHSTTQVPIDFPLAPSLEA